MLNIIIDGASFNAPKYVGENTVLSDSVITCVGFTNSGPVLLIDAVLSAGLATSQVLEGQYDFGLSGGAASTNEVGSNNWTLPAVLNDGIHSEIQIRGTIKKDVILLGGFKSNCVSASAMSVDNIGVADTIYLSSQPTITETVTNAILSTEGLNVVTGLIQDSSMNYSMSFTRADGLSGGVHSTEGIYGFLITGFQSSTFFNSGSFIAGNLVAGVILYNEPLISPSILGSLNNHFTITAYLQNGIESPSTLQASLKVDGIFIDGLECIDSSGSSLLASAYLSSGLVSNSSISTSTLLVGHYLQTTQMSSATSFDAGMYLHSLWQGGLECPSELSAILPQINCILSDGIEGDGDTSDSSMLITTLQISGGIEISDSLEASYICTCVLSAGINSPDIFNSSYQINAMLQVGEASSTSMDAQVIVSAVISSGLSQYVDTSADQAISAILHTTEFNSSDTLNSLLRADAMLHDGLFSRNISSGPLTVSFEDKYINTWAIRLKSATPQLTLITPKQDI